MKRITIILEIVLAATALVTACRNEAPDNQTLNNTAQQVSTENTITIALLPTTDCLPFYVADNMGLFDSLGVSVKLKTYQAAMDVDTAFCDSTADACVTDLVKLNHWLSKGDSVSAIFFAPLNLSLITASQARISTTEGLKEKIIAVTRNSALDFMADRVLTQAKLDLQKLNRPQINNIDIRTQMVNQNQYDGAFLPEPYATWAEVQGAKRIATLTQTKAQPMLALTVRTQTAKSKYKELCLIEKAYNEAVKRINAMRKDHATYLMKQIPLSTDIPDSIANVPTFSYSTDSLPASVEDSIISWLERRGLLRKRPVVTSYKDYESKSENVKQTTKHHDKP